MISLLLLLLFSLSIDCQDTPWSLIFPPDTWHHHVQNPYHVYYHGDEHNGGQVVDHEEDHVRSSHGHFHTCHGWTCHSDYDKEVAGYQRRREQFAQETQNSEDVQRLQNPPNNPQTPQNGPPLDAPQRATDTVIDNDSGSGRASSP